VGGRGAPPPPRLSGLRLALRRLGDAGIARSSQSFFKTGPGEYGEGDRFRGIRVPELRRLARAYRNLPLADAERLLRSEWHEDRLTALLILVLQFRAGGEAERRRIYASYVRNLRHVNNWDLVDSSAEHIVGAWLATRSRRPLRAWAGSPNLWRRRVAVLATFHLVRSGESGETLAVARRLLREPHDLIHKAVGWMLREVGNRDPGALESFLDAHAAVMPRTMLRYAIERLPPGQRRHYMGVGR